MYNAGELQSQFSLQAVKVHLKIHDLLILIAIALRCSCKFILIVKIIYTRQRKGTIIIIAQYNGTTAPSPSRAGF